MIKKVIATITLCVFLDLLYLKILHVNPAAFFSRINLEPGLTEYMISYLFCIVLACFIPKKASSFSGITIILLLVILIIPVIQFSKFTSPHFFNIVSLTGVSFFTIIGLNNFINFRIKTYGFSSNIKSIFIYSLLFISLLFFIKVYGLSPKLFSFSSQEVYSLRSATIYSSQILIIRYIVNWFPRISFGLIIYYFFTKENYFMTLLVVLIGLYSFSISSHKSFAILPIALLFILFVFREKKYFSFYTFSLNYLAVLGGLVIVASLSKETNMLVALLDRVTSVHGDLFAKYFEFFSSNPKAIWGYSFLEGLIDYPYWEWPGKLIGFYGYGSIRISANAHFLADGYANAGWLGVFIYSIFIILFCKIVDSFDNEFNFNLIFSFIFVMYISSTSPFTAMLTAGFIWLPMATFLGIGKTLKNRKTHLVPIRLN